MATKHDVYEALKAHFAKTDTAPSQANLEAAVGSHWLAIKQHLLRLREEGAVAWEPRDFTTLRLTAKTPKADKNAQKPSKMTAAPKRTRRAKAASTTVSPVTDPSPTSLEDCISVNFDETDISKLEERERVLRSMADEVAAEIAVLRQQPKLGPKGARAMQLIAEIMKGD